MPEHITQPVIFIPESPSELVRKQAVSHTNHSLTHGSLPAVLLCESPAASRRCPNQKQHNHRCTEHAHSFSTTTKGLQCIRPQHTMVCSDVATRLSWSNDYSSRYMMVSTHPVSASVGGFWLDLAENLSDTDLKESKKMKTSVVEIRTCNRKTKMR